MQQNVVEMHLGLTTKDLESYRSNLHHLQLNVLRLGQAPSCLRHGDVLDPLVVPLRCAVVCGQCLRKLCHGLSQQICGLRRKINHFNLHSDIFIYYYCFYCYVTLILMQDATPSEGNPLSIGAQHECL